MSRRARPAKCDGGRHHNTHVRLVAEVHGPLGESGTGSRDGGTHRMSVPCKRACDARALVRGGRAAPEQPRVLCAVFST